VWSYSAGKSGQRAKWLGRVPSLQPYEGGFKVGGALNGKDGGMKMKHDQGD